MIKIEKKWYSLAFEYIGISLGIFFMSMSIHYFLGPNTIAPGGVTGFAVVVETLVGIPIYLMNLIVNIPLFIFGAKTLGREAAIKTLYGTILLSFYLKVLPSMNVTTDLLLSSIFGGVLMGVGLGIVFKFGGTTGGTDLFAAILNKRHPNMSTASFMMIIDSSVVIFAGLVERNIEISLYSVIALFATVKVVDAILEGIGYLKAFYIISDYPDEISRLLMEELDRGVTSLKGKGMYTREDKEVLLCVVNRAQFIQVKEIVSRVDPKAFVVVSEIYEVSGEGFEK